MRASWLIETSVAAILLGALAAPASAQSGQDAADENAGAEDPEQAVSSARQAGSEEGAIVVTGSRIARPDYTSASPIVSIGEERLDQNAAVSVEGTLNQMPQFVADASAAETGFPNDGGQAKLNLRGLGTNRLLVLLNGRRIQPANPNGTVDVNIIPPSLIGNIEVITGGASAAYGSDAISGVVNFLVPDDFEGVQFDTQQSITSRGDGWISSVGLTVGGEFADDRGHAFVSVGYSHRDKVERQARSFFELSIINNRLPRATVQLAANPPSQAAMNALFATYGVAPGAVPRTAAISFNEDGTIFSSPGTVPPVNYRGPINNEFVLQNNAILSNSGRTYPIQMPLDRFNVFAGATYDITDDIEAYTQVLFTQYQADASVSPVSIGSGGQTQAVPVTNPFIPENLQALLATRTNPNGTFPITYLFADFDPINTAADYSIYQILAGLRGNLIGDWTWDVYGSIGRTQAHTVLENEISKSAVARLLNAPDGGASLCSGGFNPFISSDLMSPQCRAYISLEGNINSSFSQRIVEATAQGKLFALPAGDVRAAVGANYRYDNYSRRTDAAYVSGDLQGFGPELGSSGSQDVIEVFAEVLVPVLHDLPLVENFELRGAVRYSDYSTIGGGFTYSGDAVWDVTDWIRLRGSYSRAIRAPSLGEVNTPTQVTSVVVGFASATSLNGDPCDIRSSFRQGANAAQVRALCLAQGVPAAAIDSFIFTSQTVFANLAGNPDLEEETADTYSVGLILDSPFSSAALSRLRLSVDYYDIAIEGAIGSLPFQAGLQRCFNADGTSNPTYDPGNIYCITAARNPDGLLTGGVIPILNLAQYNTRGIDFQLDWSVPFSAIDLGDGSVSLNTVVTHLLAFEVVSLPGTPSLDYAGYSTSPIAEAVLPKWKSNTTLTFERGPFSIGGRWRYLSAVKEVSRLLNPASTSPGPSAYHYFDLFGSFEVNDTFTVRAGVNNLTDKDPPQIGTSPGNTDFSTYDLIGTNFYAGLTAKF